MNIIYIHTHDTGRYIQPYGYNIPTPNLMEMAREGTLFRQAYCSGPTCSPSRAGLLSGMMPHSCGMLGLVNRGFSMNDYSRHLVQFLNGHGFETVLCGVQHEAACPSEIGYSKLVGVMQEQNLPGQQGERNRMEEDLNNARIAAEYLKAKKDGPFFLSFGMFCTHRQFPAVEEDVNPDYVIPPFPLYDNARNRQDMAAYITSAKNMDRCVGIILDALREAGKEGETFIFFTTDHGIAFPMMKCHLYDTGTGVSLIVKYPDNKLKGKATEALVSQLDIFPTLCEWLGVEKPEWLQGRSFLPILENQTEKIREEIFSEVNYHAAYEPMRCIRTDRYKLICFYDDHNSMVPSNTDDGLCKDFLMESGYLAQTREKDLLFDLYMDPVERVNLVKDARYEVIYKDLSSRLKNWMEETSDPLLKGKVEKPAGAWANKRGSLSAKMKDIE